MGICDSSHAMNFHPVLLGGQCRIARLVTMDIIPDKDGNRFPHWIWEVSCSSSGQRPRLVQVLYCRR